jgi:hypothetical protein
MRRLRRVGLAVVLLALAGSGLGGTTWDGCYTYWDSDLISSYENGTFCGYWGPGCEECFKIDGSYCYSRWPERCGPRPQQPLRW